MLKLRHTTALICGLAVGFAAASAYADVRVSSIASLIVPQKTRQIAASSYYYEPLPAPGGAKYEVSISVEGALRVMLCDGPNFRRLRSGNPYRCYQTKQHGRFTVSAPASPGAPMYLVIKNENLLASKGAVWRTNIVFPADDQFVREARVSLQGFQDVLYEGLHVTEFDIVLRPCGMVNAFSAHATGDITLCTELVFDALLQDNVGSIAMVLLHELGHTLLNLWGQPNFNNEQTVDEFATVFALMMGKPELVQDWIAWFRNNENLVAEVQAARQGDLHMITPQRIQAIQWVLSNPGPTIRRWTEVIYPHMTDRGLQDVLSHGHPGNDPELARAVLAERGAL